MSVDVHRLTSSSAEPIPSRDAHIFYDTETLAIVHRSKDGGLVSTAVLLWRGAQADESDLISRQAQKLAGQYSTALTTIVPGREPTALVELLGGTLITRAVRAKTQLSRTDCSRAREITLTPATRRSRGCERPDRPSSSIRSPSCVWTPAQTVLTQSGAGSCLLGLRLRHVDPR